MNLFIIYMISVVISLYIFYWVIKKAINSSQLVSELKEIKIILRESKTMPIDLMEKETMQKDIFEEVLEKCPACGCELLLTDKKCPDCELNLD